MKDEFNSLKEALADWEDADVAAYYVGRCLGIFPPEVPFALSKSVVFTDNTVGNALYDTLGRLVEIGALEYDEEEQRYRWNQAFKAL